MATIFPQANVGREKKATWSMRRYAEQKVVDVIVVSVPWGKEPEWVEYKRCGRNNGKVAIWTSAM